MLTIFLNMYCICLYSKVAYEDAHKQAPRGKIAATRYVSEPQKCPKMRLRLRPRLRPGPRWGSLQRSPDPLAGNRGGPPGRGRENERRGEGWREGRGGDGGGVERGEIGRGRAIPPNENPNHGLVYTRLILDVMI